MIITVLVSDVSPFGTDMGVLQLPMGHGNGSRDTSAPLKAAAAFRGEFCRSCGVDAGAGRSQTIIFSYGPAL